MVSVTDQYDAYPYPARNPDDEAKRLIVGSPSNPVEIDHFLFGGQRDWTTPLRVLVAGGGSGDGLIQLAQMLTSANKPYEIMYVDLSISARKIAEARVKKRGLQGIKFVTDSLLNVAQYGEFDYIDCCGVLHHLPDPAAGFAALNGAVAPGGGMGFMVYAPYGRSGVYPLQDAFNALLKGLSPAQRLQRAKEILKRLPEGHPFLRNKQLNDHLSGDAGFYDLLLHSQDRAFDVGSLLDMMDQTGWSLCGFCTPALYDPRQLAGSDIDLDPRASMEVAEKLRGTMKVHVGYAVPKSQARSPAHGPSMSLIPHLTGGSVQQLAQQVAKGRSVNLRISSEKVTLSFPAEAAPLIAAINGRRSVADISTIANTDMISFGRLWPAVETPLIAWGLLHYSSVLR